MKRVIAFLLAACFVCVYPAICPAQSEMADPAVEQSVKEEIFNYLGNTDPRTDEQKKECAEYVALEILEKHCAAGKITGYSLVHKKPYRFYIYKLDGTYYWIDLDIK